MKKPKLSLFKDGKINLKLLTIAIGISTIAIAGIGWKLIDSGILFINNPDRRQFPIRGIDVSNHQHQIDWQRIDKSGLNFVLIKSTEGGDYKDSFFIHNWQNAQQQGAIVGAYHFFTFCKSGREQAQNYTETVPRLKRSLPPVIDLEFAGNCNKIPTSTELERELTDFIAIVEKFYQKKPILYVTHEFYDRYLQHKYSEHPVWISDFYSFNKLPSLADRKPWLFWQYSERGRIAGISTPVDLNVFNGTQSQFDRLTTTNEDTN